MAFLSRRARVLRKTTVAFRAEGPALKGPVINIAAQHVTNNDPFADATGINLTANRNDNATTIGTLNARELKWHTRPTGVVIVDFVETLGTATVGGTVNFLRIPADAGIDVGIIDARCCYFYQNFHRAGRWHRHVVAIVQLINTAVANQLHGKHVFGYGIAHDNSRYMGKE